MHDGAETQEIVEGSAEHDFQEMRLSGMIRAFGCEDIVFLHIASALKNKGLLTPKPNLYM